MARILWEITEARSRYLDLVDSPLRRELGEHVESVLEDLEQHPGAGRLKRNQFRDEYGRNWWRIPVSGSGEDWVVTWRREDADVVIGSIGPWPR